jgi:Ser/Thr protein kinase RdoA (MazF antagonist)
VTDTALRLPDADLRLGRFAAADLRDAELQHATLVRADLRRADLRGARLRAADLTLADLRDADLRGADLQGADLSGADLRGARCDGADLSEATLEWSWLVDVQGLPEGLAGRLRPDGRLPGAAAVGDADEPAAGLRALARGKLAHGEGKWGLAERYFGDALVWVPESDVVRWHLAAVALERGDLACAHRWLAEAVAINPAADRARAELAVLAWRRDDAGAARAWLQPAVVRVPWLAEVLASADPLTELRAHLPALFSWRWQARQRPPVRHRDAPTDSANERAALTAALAETSQSPWVWHGVLARALSAGALDLAFRAARRLGDDVPEHQLWTRQLHELDLTGQAFDALARTRGLGAVRGVQWRALGVHGPTARLDTDAGIAYAKRHFAAVRPAASLAFSHRVLRVAAERGLRVAPALSAGDGAEILEFDGDFLSVYPDLGGAPMTDDDLTPAEAERAGATLALLHTTLADLATGAGRPRGGVRVGSRVLRSREPAQAWRAIVGQAPAALEALAELPALATLLERLQATGRRLRGDLAEARPALVHGDFGPGNVLVQDDGPWAVVDWDLCDVDLAVWDLARAIDRSSVVWSADPGAPVEVRAEVAQAWLRGYSAHQPLLAAERRALPVLMAASRVDLDAHVLALAAGLEVDMATQLLRVGCVRLARAAAGAPELDEALG